MKPASLWSVETNKLGILLGPMGLPTMMDLFKRYVMVRNFGDTMRRFTITQPAQKTEDICNHCRILHFYLLLAIIGYNEISSTIWEILVYLAGQKIELYWNGTSKLQS